MKEESKKISLNKLFLPVLVGVIIIAGSYGCDASKKELKQTEISEPAAQEYEQADNSFCYVCHLNFQDEPFATWHQNANVGCVDCHGDSDLHSADESHVIPPDNMYKKSDVNASCMNCHSKATLEKQIGHRPFFEGSDPDRKYCTDCHGNHSIPKRHRVWDKDTGKLIEADGNKVE